MKIHILYFATFRDLTGLREEDLTLQNGATVVDLKNHLIDLYPAVERGLPTAVVAINREFAFDDDGLTDNDPQQFKCAKNDSTWIIYLANPEKTNILETKMHKYTEIKDANESNINPEISIFLPNENFTLKWYDPGTGTWSITKKTNGGQTELQAPGPGDWILLLARE